MLKIKNFKLKILNSQHGFTIIEAVVATGLFAFVISSIMGVYIATIQLDRKSRAQRAVAQNARFIMDYFAKEIRNGSVDYSVTRDNDLYILNQARESERFFLQGTDLMLTKDVSAALGGGTISTALNSSGVKVTSLVFFIAPVDDPYTLDKTFNEQPHVTILLQLTSNYGGQQAEVAKLNVQDTYAVRIYPPRQ